MPTLAHILHNLRDHVVVARAILERDAARGDARRRLLEHMLREEAENRRLLAVALPSAALAERQVIELAIEHSRLLEDIIRGDEIAPELGLELLEHFQEEHDEGMLAPPATRGPAPTTRPAPAASWTVGPLRSARRDAGGTPFKSR